MLINFIKKGTYGYLREDHMGIHTFFSNNNLSFRRSAVDDIGGYRESLRIAEDYDICQRIARAGWLLYLCPEISLGHRARQSFKALIKQWWQYGWHMQAGHYRHHPDKIILTWNKPVWDDSAFPEPLLGAQLKSRNQRHKIGFSTFVFFSSFMIFHLLLGVAFLLQKTGCKKLYSMLVTMGIACFAVYIKSDLSVAKKHGWIKAIGLIGIRYFVNLAFLSSGLIGSMSRGNLYIFPPLSSRTDFTRT